MACTPWGSPREPGAYSFVRYLEAKRPVDARAVDSRVETRFRDHLEAFEEPVAVLDVGAGTGAMVRRFLTWHDTPANVAYTLLDADPTVLAYAATVVPTYARKLGYRVTGRDPVRLARADQRVTVRFEAAPVSEYLATGEGEWAVIIAQAFLDLVDVPTAISTLRDALAPHGCLYFPITFDGETVFRPVIDAEVDRRIIARYHRDMEATGGTSRAGRAAIDALQRTEPVALALGGSDWAVIPTADGYPADTAYFLHYLISIFNTAVRTDPTLSPQALAAWCARRHEQIESGTLVYLTHQLDLFAAF